MSEERDTQPPPPSSPARELDNQIRRAEIERLAGQARALAAAIGTVLGNTQAPFVFFAVMRLAVVAARQSGMTRTHVEEQLAADWAASSPLRG